MPRPSPVVHFEIGCQNAESSRKFYAEVFGWNFEAFGQAQMVTNVGPSHDGSPPKTPGIGGHVNCLGHPPHQYVTFYIQVDDLKATLAEIEKRGGKTIIPPQDIPNMGSFAWFADPEGNTLGLWRSLGG
ncbi:MAG: VOC family protein [Phycisphaerales bacterium]